MEQVGLITFRIVVTAVMIFGLAGVISTLLPGLVIMWAGALVYGVVTGFNTVSGICFAAQTVLMLVGSIIDNFIMGASARQKGASWVSIAVSLVLGIAGSIIFPPFGGLIAALLGLFAVEWARLRNWREALESTRHMAMGCGWSTLIRIGMALVILGLWAVWLLFA